ncbi:MAG TPA: T9SS type A sorting domain-containing protein [Catalimonadaceae bacterium]|nr:T9SS type A sorting domain-containing protein [Catalimonadaceae bacterium]
MTKKLLAIVMVLAALGDAYAGNNPVKRTARLDVRQQKFSRAEQQLRQARAEAQLLSGSNPKPFQQPAKRKGKGNSVQASSLTFSDLGQSVNPFTSIGGGRNYLSVVPELNAVALIRRGGPTDPGGSSSKPGDKLFLDLNTRGGDDGFWQISRNRLFNNELYDISTSNHGPRYPQGLLFNPPGNSDTAMAFAMAITRVLDGSNDTWGGYGRGWAKLLQGSQTKQTLASSGDFFHFRSESMISTSLGSVFTIEAEEVIEGENISFTNRIMVNRFKYNSTTQSFDSSTVFLPFTNDGADSASDVGNAAIAFAPDGLHGYAVIAGYNKDFSRPFGNIPYFSRTTDGGDSWSDFKPIDYNKSIYEKGNSSPDKDEFRDGLFVGNYVVFTDTSIVRADSSTQPGAHPVDYTMMDFDLSVDKNNQAHIFGTLCVGGFGDTLELTGPNFFRPQNGSWNVHISIKASDDTGRGTVISTNQAVQGCFGDCAVTAESFKELNRPQIAQSADGSILALCWSDTDLEAYPQTADDNNNNPDLWMRVMRVGANGEVFMNSQNRNLTKGSDRDGLATQASIAPVLLNSANGFELAATTTIIPDYVFPMADLAVQHLFVRGISVPSASDSTPVPVTPELIILKNNEVLSSNGKLPVGLDLLPNPAGSVFSAHLTNLTQGTVEIRITNLLGQVIETRSIQTESARINVPFNLRKVPKGIYLISVRNAGQTTTNRIILE